MEAKLRRDVQLFKKILTHERFGDHVEEIRFPNPICLTGVKIGAAPGIGSPADTPYVHVFAQDLHTLSGSRYACAAEHCSLPDSGTRAVRVEPIFTKQLLLRGQYQTLPLAIYGWVLTALPTLKDEAELIQSAKSELASVTARSESQDTLFSSILPFQSPFSPPFLALPSAAAQALQHILPKWASVRTFEQAMRYQPLDKIQLQALLTAAEQICQAAYRQSPQVQPGDKAAATADTARTATATAVKEEPEVDLVGNSTLAGLPETTLMDLNPIDSLPAEIATAVADAEPAPANEAAVGECAAYMAAEWCGVLGGAYASASAAEFGLAGLAAAVIVASCPKHATHFIAAQGHLALASVLSLMRPPKSVVRYAITAIELLTRSAGALACEAVFGWLELPELPEEKVQAAQATAASFGAALARRKSSTAAPGDGAAPATGAEGSRAQDSSQAGSEPRASKHGRHDHERDQEEEEAPAVEAQDGADEQPDEQQDEQYNEYNNGNDAASLQGGSDDQNDQDYDQDQDQDFEQQRQDYDPEQYPDQQEDEQQYNGEDPDNDGYDEMGEGPEQHEQQPDNMHLDADDADHASKNGHEWDIPDTGGEIDEMMAETPERLSDLEDDKMDEQPDFAGAEAQPTGEAQGSRSAQKPGASDGNRTSSISKKAERDSQSREPNADKAVSPDKGQTYRADSEDRSKARGESKERRRSSRHDKEKKRRHSRDRHRSRDRSKDRDRDRRHKERKSRSKRSRSRDQDEERASKRSHRDRSRHSRDRHSAEPPKPEARPDVKEAPGPSAPNPPSRPAPQPKGLVVVKAKQFDGCYSQLVDKLLELQPKQVLVTGAALLARLQLYAVIARTTGAAEQLVKGYTGSSPQMSMQQSSKLISSLAAHLSELSQALLQSDEPVPASKGLAADQPGNHLPCGGSPDACTVSALASRQLLELLAAALHVPSLHAAHMAASGNLPPQAKSPQVEAALLQPLLSGVKALVSVLLSTPSGLAYLVQQQEASQHLTQALNSRSGSTKGCAFALAQTLASVAAAQQILQGSPTSHPSPGAPSQQAPLQRLLQALWEQSVSLAGRNAVNAALVAVPGALQKLLALLQVEAVKAEAAGANGRGQPHFSPVAMYAGQLLLQLVSDDHAHVLRSWAAHATDLHKLAGEALPSTSAAVARHTLQALQARAQAGIALADKGPTSLVQTLSGVLPPLADSDVKGIYVVESESAIAFAQDVGKLNTAEGALHLLGAVLSQQHATLDAVAATEVNGLQALERALRTGVMLLTAAQADTMWSVSCGNAIDDAKQMTNRWQVVKFVLAASSTIRALFARLQQRNTHLHSISLLDCLLAAHATISTTSESLAAAIGNAPAADMQCVLQARQALTAALKIWWDNAPDWQPALLPAIFVGAKAAALDRMADTIKMPGGLYCCICVISDLFPSEWPPVQVRKGVPHPAPTHMAYRAALAKSLEPVKHGFRDMVNVAVASESRMFRAAFVRLAARAAGLGGGMGVFLAEPITNALNEALTASAALAEVRRVLELIVPLAYRPPIKAAFLDLKLAGMLGQLLGRLVPVLGQGADAGSLCTMVLEAILTLQDPETCLNPMAPALQRVPDETPAPAEGGLIAATIMASLSRLGGNAHVAKRILRMLSTHLPGRVVLRLGAAKWQANMTGGDFSKAVGSKASLQWAASRLWAAAEAVGADPKLRSTNQEAAQMLEQVAALGEDAGESDLTPPSGPAPNRFAAAVKASVEAAAAAGTTKVAEASDFLDAAHPMVQLFDPASNTFWRNVKERAVAPVTAFGRNPVRWNCWQSQHVPAVSEWLPRSLTPAKRSREARLGGQPQGGGGLASPSQKLKTEASSGAGQGSSVAAAAAKAVAGPMPGDDLPPVIAPPGRSRAQQLRGRVSSNSSRPASLHVDDFEKAAGLSITPKLPAIAASSPGPLATHNSGSLTPRDSTTYISTPRATAVVPTAAAPAGGGAANGLVQAEPVLRAVQLAPSAARPTAGDTTEVAARAPKSVLTSKAGPAGLKQEASSALTSSPALRAVSSGMGEAAAVPTDGLNAALQSSQAANQGSGQQQQQPVEATPLAPFQALSEDTAMAQAAELSPAVSSAEPAGPAHPVPASLPEPSSSSTAQQQQPAQELIEVDPFEGLEPSGVSPTAQAPSKPPQQHLAQAHNGDAHGQAAAQPRLPASVAAVSSQAAALNLPRAAQALPTPMQGVSAQQPTVGNTDQEAAPDLYSGFDEEPSAVSAHQPSGAADLSSLLQTTTSGGLRTVSPAISPDPPPRPSSASSSQGATPRAGTAAAGPSRRDPRRAGLGPRPSAVQPASLGAAGFQRGSRQGFATLEPQGQGSRPAQAAALPSATAPAPAVHAVPGTAAPTTRPATGPGLARQMPTSTAAPAAAVARQTPAGAGLSRQTPGNIAAGPAPPAAGARPAVARQSSTASASAPALAAASSPSAAASGAVQRGQAGGGLSASQQAQIPALMQALTRGGPVLQEFLKGHPDMRAAIPVVLQLLQTMKKT